MSKLFSTIKIKDIEFKNRIVMPPMCMYVSDSTGVVTDFHLTHYATRAIGGVGFIIIEATSIEPCGRLTDNCLGLWDDSQIEGMTKLCSQIKAYGSVAGIQINHGGRKCNAKSEKVIYGPSDIPFNDSYLKPTQMTVEKIKQTVELFKDSALRAQKAGFDYLEIHGAHGYLISQFLSPLVNTRQDGYGGSHENRARFLGEVIDACKSVFNGVIGLRVSAFDYAEGGNTPDDLIAMINLVKHKGVDVLHVSSGAVVDVVPKVYPGYQIEFATQLKNGCNLPTIGGGMLTSPELMEEIIANNRADMVFVGRELLRNPYFALKSAHDLKDSIEWVKPYERSKFD